MQSNKQNATTRAIKALEGAKRQHSKVWQQGNATMQNSKATHQGEVARCDNKAT
jgi:hypothetical protein